MEKKITEWLNELPEPYRSQALENFNGSGREDIIVENILDAIDEAIYNNKPPQGIKYWCDVQEHYHKGTPLPKAWEAPEEPKQPTPDPYEKEFIDRAAIALNASGFDLSVIEAYEKAKELNKERKKQNP